MTASESIRSYADAHRSVGGPGDARPTALQILEDNELIDKLTNKTFLVTGGTDGIGFETVRQLAKTGAKVFFTARNETKAEKVIQTILEESKGAKIQSVKIDNGSLSSVKEGAEDFLRRSNELHVLICNAGKKHLFFHNSYQNV